MRSKYWPGYRGLALLGSLSLAIVGTSAAQVAAPTKVQTDDAAGFKEFTTRVDEYLKLRNSIEKQLPSLKSKEELPELISAHQQALARKIREARPTAKSGDIFTRESREAFKHVIRRVFRDLDTATKIAIAKQRDPITPIRLKVNGNYPESIAETTFPSALLEKLPILPEELSYRIMGRDLILEDRKANLVIDVLREALP